VGRVRIKIARWPSGKIANASPEYEDCRSIARQHSVPLKEVMRAAIELTRTAKRKACDGSLAIEVLLTKCAKARHRPLRSVGRLRMP